MIISLKVISLLLSYPTVELQEAAPALKQALSQDTLTSETEKSLLGGLADNIASLDLYDAQERYVHLFDRTRSLSLHLFEHVHGESRDRGQAMVDLMDMYDQKGLAIDAKELPDHIPLFVEFLSTQPAGEARELLEQTLHIVSAIKERLIKRDSHYHQAFEALERFTQKTASSDQVSELLNVPDDDPDDLEALDRIWEDEVVMFGANAGENNCGTDRLRMQVRAGRRKPADPVQMSSNYED